MTTPHVKLETLSVTSKDQTILDAVSLDFEAGLAHVILGPSGSGKTTLLRCVNRLNDLFSELQVTGEVFVPWDQDMRPIYTPPAPAEQLRRRVGMVFQNPNILPVSIRENFRIPLESVLGYGPQKVDHHMNVALKEAGLWDEVKGRLSAPAARLSGGQQQRLCLARALAMDPAVLLLDEPTANLDFRATTAIESLIANLKQTRVLLVVSHSLDQANRIADRVVALDQGHVVLDTPVENAQRSGVLQNRVKRLFP